MSKKSVIPATRQGVTHVADAKSVEQVKSLAAVGVSQVQIATLLGITDDTFRKYYNEVFNQAKIQAIGMVAGTLFTKATKDKDLGAAIFYLKSQAGWRETPSVADLAGAFNIHIHL